MKIAILMRHGKAAPMAETDALRPLTAAGREDVRRAALKLHQSRLRPDLLLHSPLLRARQTAQAVSAVLNIPPQCVEELDGRMEAQELIDFTLEKLQKANCVLIISHNPSLSWAAGILADQYVSLHTSDMALFDMTCPQTPKPLFFGGVREYA